MGAFSVLPAWTPAMTDKRPTLSIKPKAATAKAGPSKKPYSKPAAAKPAPAKPVHAYSPPAPVQRAPEPVQQLNKPVLQPGYKPDLKSDSLALALLGAANAVAQVRGGTALPSALSMAFGVAGPTPQTRGAIQDIAYRAMRQAGRSEVLLGLMTTKAPEPAMLACLLICALALLDPPPGTEAPYEPFTIVDQAVTAASSHPDLAHAKAMVNAVLRRYLREKDALLEQAMKQPLAQWNYPQWWIDAMRAAYPANWDTILTAGNQPPPLTLRVNLRKTSMEAYARQLQDAGIDTTVVGPTALRLAQAVNVAMIPGFEQGLASVQDAGAQLAAPLLDVQDGMRVLDACAAPGGKSGHLLELADIELTAIDSDAKRLTRVADNLERLGLSATLNAFDAQHRDWWDGVPFDRILADVPCTASGIVRRHPDIRWLRRRGDALQLATLSSKILDNLWQMLGPNGKLLFVTCSLWPQESEAQAAAFAVRNGAVRLAAPGQLLPVSAAGQDHDGLFYALFQKNAA
jgi:16S rRNA (cytosine967-C5)-methyltransferase